jgi:predicted transcriptional regulator
MKVLLSIKPEFVDKIIKGEKRFEYRRKIFKKDVESVIIYATSPWKKIIGEFYIEEILAEDPKILWSKTYRFSGVEKEFFMDYFKDSGIGYAIKIGKLELYKEPYNITDLVNTPPQSYVYII